MTQNSGLDPMLKAVQQLAGGGTTGVDEVLRNVTNEVVRATNDSQGTLTVRLDSLRQVTDAQRDAVTTNTQAILQNTATAASSSGNSGAAIAGKVLSSVFGSAFGLSPVISGILKLFGGGSDGGDQATPLVKYSAPAPVRLEAGIDTSAVNGFSLVDYGPQGVPRLMSENRPATRPPAQITVQVQTMDSRSFLDHSADIARAVREAMLNSHSINDVMSEL